MKKVFLAILALTSIGVFAFIPKQQKTDELQFKYVGPSSTSGYTNPQNWQMGEDLEFCDETGTIACVVIPNNPSIDTINELVAEISANGLSNLSVLDYRP
jgi:hypothetical protein